MQNMLGFTCSLQIIWEIRWKHGHTHSIKKCTSTPVLGSSFFFLLDLSFAMVIVKRLYIYKIRFAANDASNKDLNCITGHKRG